jgi:hypothetical protein
VNERIRQLAEQAEKYADTYDDANGPIWFQMYNEKLAELIIKKCGDIVSAAKDQAIEEEWNVDEAMSTSMYDIEEYFGIE